MLRIVKTRLSHTPPKKMIWLLVSVSKIEGLMDIKLFVSILDKTWKFVHIGFLARSWFRILMSILNIVLIVEAHPSSVSYLFPSWLKLTPKFGLYLSALDACILRVSSALTELINVSIVVKAFQLIRFASWTGLASHWYRLFCTSRPPLGFKELLSSKTL